MGYSTESERHEGTTLTDAVRMWPTPRASDTTGAGEHGDGGMDLRTRASLWATPAARDWKDGADPSENVETNGLLGRQAPRTMKDGSGGAALSPAFVETLMGLPLGWTVPTVSAVSGMESYLCKQRSLLGRLLGEP